MTNEQAWNFAIGIVQLDDIKPSEEFLELVGRQKRGEITNEDIRTEFFASMLSANNIFTTSVLY